jgi:hypothetical protein
MGMHMRAGGSGELAVAVTYPEPVIFQVKSLSYFRERIPEVMLCCGRQVQKVRGVFMRNSQEMQSRPLIRELVRYNHPVFGFPEDFLARPPKEDIWAEEAKPLRLELLHLCKLFIGSVVLHAVKAHNNFLECMSNNRTPYEVFRDELSDRRCPRQRASPAGGGSGWDRPRLEHYNR